MALRFLLDTSVIERLGNPQVRAVVEPMADAGELGRALTIGPNAASVDARSPTC
ncbi:MAG: hypothetical protein LH461_05740 [Spirochaetaceae bacterium]|nr:hypothetical protein [Spirochaetaceae bacterium]